VPFTLRTLSQFTLAFDPTNLHTKGGRIGSRSCPMALSLSGSLRKYQLKRDSASHDPLWRFSWNLCPTDGCFCMDRLLYERRMSLSRAGPEKTHEAPGVVKSGGIVPENEHWRAPGPKVYRSRSSSTMPLGC
jgi:hypothetical protein